MQTNRKITCDVAVVGGGAAGIAAALGAAKTGANTVLLERNPYFGGQATHSNVAFYCGFFTNGEPPARTVRGIGEAVLQRLHDIGEYDEPYLSPAGNTIVTLDPEALKYVLDRLVQDSGIQYRLHCSLIGANRNESGIQTLECVDDVGRLTVEASSFVDASGDANLAYLGGADTVFGSDGDFNQMSTMILRLDGVSPEAKLSPKDLVEPLTRAKAEGYRITKVKGLILRRDADSSTFAILPSAAVKSLDCQALTNAEMDVRAQARDYVTAMRKYMPGMEKCRLTATGPRLGLRETRRIIGTETLVADDVLSSRKRDDSIARGSWRPEIHRDLDAMAEYLGEPGDKYFSIPYGSITSKNTANLWCGGRTISADCVAFASVRVMGTGFATGHAAGIAAALHANGKTEVRHEQVQAELLRQDALI